MRVLLLLLVPAMAIQWNWFAWKRPPPNPQVDSATLAFVGVTETGELNDTYIREKYPIL